MHSDIFEIGLGCSNRDSAVCNRTQSIGNSGSQVACTANCSNNYSALYRKKYRDNLLKELQTYANNTYTASNKTLRCF